MARRNLYQPQYTNPGFTNTDFGSSVTDDSGAGGAGGYNSGGGGGGANRDLANSVVNTRNEVEYLKAVDSAQNPLLDNRMRVLSRRLKDLEGRRERMMDDWDDAKVQQRRDRRTAGFQLGVARQRKQAVRRLGDEATRQDKRKADAMLRRAKSSKTSANQSVKPKGLSKVNQRIKGTSNKITQINKRDFSTTQNNLRKINTPPRGFGGVGGQGTSAGNPPRKGRKG